MQDNGGPIFTHALLCGSPAIDKGKNFSGSVTDQRGLPWSFDRPQNANAPGGDGSDIGAYETQQFCTPFLSNFGITSNRFDFNINAESVGIHQRRRGEGEGGEKTAMNPNREELLFQLSVQKPGNEGSLCYVEPRQMWKLPSASVLRLIGNHSPPKRQEPVA